jgi:hypothetical protein
MPHGAPGGGRRAVNRTGLAHPAQATGDVGPHSALPDRRQQCCEEIPQHARTQQLIQERAHVLPASAMHAGTCSRQHTRRRTCGTHAQPERAPLIRVERPQGGGTGPERRAAGDPPGCRTR